MSGGGTAGHTTPLVAVANELEACARRRGTRVELHYIGQKGDTNAQVLDRANPSIVMHSVRAGKYRRYHNRSWWHSMLDVKTNVLNVRDVLFVLIGFLQSFRLLRRIKPDIVFCKGGFVVVPVGFAAGLLGIPYITHDSDTVPGLANRLIAKKATLHAVAHHGIAAYPAKKTIVTGVPVGEKFLATISRSEARRLLHIDESARVVFVYTGTQGAKCIDDALDSQMDALLADARVQVVHVFGRLNSHSMERRYSALSMEKQARIQKLTFIDNADQYMAASDVIIARAGATSLAECAAVGRAVIVVPAEQLTGGHQVVNAKVFAEANAVVVVRESAIGSLAETTATLLADTRRRQALEKAIHEFAGHHAARKIAELLLAEAGR